MKEMWDRRYAGDAFAYGKAPNRFLAESLSNLSPGKILLPGEGEGRNAIFAAALGWEVSAFDQSDVARDKALAWARKEGHVINYSQSTVQDYDFTEAGFDAVGLVFLHPPPELRALLHSRVSSALKPGGKLILQGFHKRQAGRKSGGPDQEALLFDRQTLEKDFESLRTIHIEENEVLLDEGPFHQGEAALVSYVGKRM